MRVVLGAAGPEGGRAVSGFARGEKVITPNGRIGTVQNAGDGPPAWVDVNGVRWPAANVRHLVYDYDDGRGRP